MYLSERLDAFKQQQYLKVPAVILSKLHDERMKILATGFLEQALRKGDKMPDFFLTNQHGDLVHLGSLLTQSPVVLSFFRGGWCNYDGMELESLRDSYADIIEQGATLLAISPENPANSLAINEKYQLPFDILYDRGSAIARQLGISYELTETIQDIYEAYGVDISVNNGDGSFVLPVPATYIIAQDSTIAELFMDMDHTRRMEPATIIELLQRVGDKSCRSA